MGPRTDILDLAQLRLAPGEGRRLDLSVVLDPFEFSAERYSVSPGQVPVTLDLSRMSGNGYSFRLRMQAALDGPCMRCLEKATPVIEVEAREVDVPGKGEELDSPYVVDKAIDLRSWGRDALALALPVQIVCREDCAGLCPDCGENLNRAESGHSHDRPADPRWAKLRELKLD